MQVDDDCWAGITPLHIAALVAARDHGAAALQLLCGAQRGPTAWFDCQAGVKATPAEWADLVGCVDLNQQVQTGCLPQHWTRTTNIAHLWDAQ